MRYIPTLDDRLRVRELASIGMSDDDIASLLRLRLPKVQRLFRLELKQGAATGREQALQKLHTIAISGENLNALLFSVKARCGWRDTGPAQSSPNPINRIVMFGQALESPSPPPAPPESDDALPR